MRNGQAVRKSFSFMQQNQIHQEKKFQMILLQAMYSKVQSDPSIECGVTLCSQFLEEVSEFVASLTEENMQEIFRSMRTNRFPRKKLLGITSAPAAALGNSAPDTALETTVTATASTEIQGDLLEGIPESGKIEMARVVNEMVRSYELGGQGQSFHNPIDATLLNPLELENINSSNIDDLIAAIDEWSITHRKLDTIFEFATHMQSVGMVYQYLLYKKGCELLNKNEFRAAMMRYYRIKYDIIISRRKWDGFLKAKTRGSRILQLSIASGLDFQARHERILWSVLYILNDTQIEKCVQYCQAQKAQHGIPNDWKETISDALMGSYSVVAPQELNVVASEVDESEVEVDVDVNETTTEDMILQVERNLALPPHRRNRSDTEDTDEEGIDDVYVSPKRMRVPNHIRAFIDDDAEESDE